jgi:hypothetical protein
MRNLEHVCTYSTEETGVPYSTVGISCILSSTLFELSHSFKRVYRRYAATPGMIRYTLSLDLTMFRTDLIKNQSRVRSMIVQYKDLRTHAVHLCKKIKGERMIVRVKIKRRIKRRRRKWSEKKCIEEKI